MTRARRRFTIGSVLGATALACLFGPLAALIGGLISIGLESAFNLLFDGLLLAVIAALYGVPLCLMGVVLIGWPVILLLNARGRCTRRAILAASLLAGLASFLLIPAGGFYLPLGCVGAGLGLVLGLGPLNRTTLDSAPQDA